VWSPHIGQVTPPGEVARLRAAAGTFATRRGASDALVADVRIAVSEALSNAIMHAYSGAPGRLAARANADPTSGLMTFSVRDYGGRRAVPRLPRVNDVLR
jgi:anti-sigma regulatory factor (Ser/Thr protein kinase)